MKNIKKTLVVLILCSFIMGTIPVSVLAQQNNPSNQIFEHKGQNLPDDKQYAPDEVIVKFKPDISEKAKKDFKTKNNVKSMDKILKETNDEFKKNSHGLDRLYLLKLSKNTDINKIVKKFNEDHNIEYAQPNFIYTIDSTPNDPYFDDLWGLHNTGQEGGTTDADIDAPEAWDIFTGNSDVVIAVIDTGIQYTHLDLADNMWTNPGEIPGNGIDDDGNGYEDDVHGWDFVNNDNDPWDDHWHGTHVAGTIGAVRNNENGVAGVNPNVELMALKFLDEKGRGSTVNAVKCVNYAEMNDVKITSNSWGGGGFDQALYDAIEASNSLFVAAAGNEGLDNDVTPHYPSSYNLDNILSVAASDRNDARASFSNYGITSVDIYAPGVDILSTYKNNWYAWAGGTSMAAPHASGVAGLLFSMNPSSTPIQIKNIIMNSVDPTLENVVSGGRLNAHSALLSAIPTNQPPVADAGPDQTAETGVTLSFDGSESTDSNGTIVSYEWDFGDVNTSDVVTTTHAYSTAGPYTVTLTVTDDDGATDSDTAIVTVSEPSNQPPVANAGSDQTAETGVTLPFDGSGSTDSDGTIVSYDWDFGDGNTDTGMSTTHAYSTADTYTVTLTVTDDDGATDSDTAIVTVSEPSNQPPVANAGSDQTAETGVTLPFDGSGSTDSDGTIVSYDWDFGDGNTDTGMSTTHAYSTADTYTVTLTVTDDDGATDTDTATVTVSEVGALPTMYISSIDVSFTSTKKAGPNIFGYATAVVTIVNETGIPVQDAIVSGYWSGATSDSDDSSTNNSGTVSLDSDTAKVRSGDKFTFTVGNVTHSGFTYNASANVEDQDYIIVP